jgi:hypothetical protein
MSKIVLKLTLALVASLALLSLFLYFYPGFELKYRINSDPELFGALDALPERRTVKEQPLSPNDKIISVQGITLHALWPVEDTRDHELMTSLAFAGSKKAIISAGNLLRDSFLGKEEARERDRISLALAGIEIYDNYGLARFILSTTPSHVGYFTPKSSLAYKALLIKEIIMRKPPIYDFSLDGVQGFQLGTPGQGTVDVWMYDSQDREFQLAFSEFTQDEIDYFISNIQFK